MLDIIAWSALLAGVAVIAIAIASRSRFQAQGSWTEVPGVIAASEAKLRDELYAPEVRFSYSFSGREYVGEKVRSGLVCYNWRGPAEKICSRYSVGTPVSVYVNATNPSDSVLERGGDRTFGPLLYSIAAVLITVAAVLLTNK